MRADDWDVLNQLNCIEKIYQSFDNGSLFIYDAKYYRGDNHSRTVVMVLDIYDVVSNTDGYNTKIFNLKSITVNS